MNIGTKPKIYIIQIGKLENNTCDWFAQCKSLQLCESKNWCLDVIQDYDIDSTNNKYIIEFNYIDNKTNLTGMKILSFDEIQKDSFIDKFEIDISRKIEKAYISDGQEELDVTEFVNYYYLPVHNDIKIEEMVDKDGTSIVPRDCWLCIENKNKTINLYHKDNFSYLLE